MCLEVDACGVKLMNSRRASMGNKNRNGRNEWEWSDRNLVERF